MTTRPSHWFATIVSIAALSLGLSACGDDTGYDDCVAACEGMAQCFATSAPDPASTSSMCEQSCESQEEHADDYGCYDEWESYQACLVEGDVCDFMRCQDVAMEQSTCQMEFCRDNPNEPECMMDSAPSSGSGGSGAGETSAGGV